MKKIVIVVTLLSYLNTFSQQIIRERKQPGDFALVSENTAANILVDENDYAVVKIVANLLKQDISAVTAKKPTVIHGIPSSAKTLIIIGSLEKSKLIQRLIQDKKLSVADIKNKWEGYRLQVVAKPFNGIDQALVLVGNDRRGTAYAAMDLSREIGVSPWYWWADVPVKQQKELYVRKDLNKSDYPRVKYRGIFINDEAPALSGWSKEKFGGFNHLFYEKVFELMLRLKSNYLWPAMWGNAFYDDDSLNIRSADNYAIVIGTSHHEPLMRAHDEWRRYGKGKWNYDSNAVQLRDFWRTGMARAKNEKIVSVGMRGDGDEPMSRQTATALLERIVKDQREIIEDVTKKPAEATPQLWALYKEVQDYYDKGMRVPDDVTLLLCDDNWGNIRKLPNPVPIAIGSYRENEAPRKGGYGIYYHFDYVGGPRNYKWINTNNISRVWEQMHLAWEYKARQIWIVNVGDIKPMELPISFFIDYAWNPDRINAEDLPAYHVKWAAEQFGNEFSKDIGYVLQKYTQFNSRRKPELLSSNTYSLNNYKEADRVLKEYSDVRSKAENVYYKLPRQYQDAYFQLVLHPVQASHNLNHLYVAVAKNQFYASERSEPANKYAEEAKESYEYDSLLSRKYHTILNGKWNHMMSQTHIGYTSWQQPPVNRMPEVKTLTYDSLISESRNVVATPTKNSREQIPNSTKNLFYEEDGYVSIEAANYTRAVNKAPITWKVIPDIGRTGSGITSFPVTSAAVVPGGNSPVLEYEFYSYDSGDLKLNTYFSPTLNFYNNDGLKFAVSIDDEKPQIVVLNKEDNQVGIWNRWVGDNIIIKTTTHQLKKPGKHILKYWMVDPAIVLQKLVLDFGGLKPSYLGPPETKASK